MDQNGAGGEKRWVVKVGEGSSLCTLSVVTKGIKAEVITGWARLSPCPRPVLEPGRARGAVGYQQSRGRSKQCPAPSQTQKHLQHPAGAREQEQNSWPGMEQQEELEADPCQPPMPSSEPGLLQCPGGALLKAFTELAHFHPASIPETGTAPAPDRKSL